MNNIKIFPYPASLELADGRVKLDGKVSFENVCDKNVNAFIRAVKSMELVRGEGNIKLINDESISNPEGYELKIGCTVEVRAKSTLGFGYAASTLSQLIAEDFTVPMLEIKDEPYKKVRGVHMYLPPDYALDEFCRLVDALVHLKFNTIILEMGGGIEYERHPEINIAWRKFCREARDFPKGPQGLQASQADWKDSTHVELGDGGILKKSQVKYIVDYARSCGMEVIPEIQALSHSYYLTLAHREIAERPYEPWPDTYCPLNEDSYKLYFDVASEIHELLGFTKVSIGHDEVRIIGYCPKCKQKTGHELLAYELNKLHDFYASIGVEVWMWGEKLQNFESKKGRVGKGFERYDRFGRMWKLNETYKAIDEIPTDMVMLDWYYSHAPFTEKEFLDRGIREIYGNFKGSTIANWQERSKRENVMGAEVSTWCIVNENELGRNGWIPEFIFSGAVLWQHDYDDDKRTEFFMKTVDKISDIRSILRGECTRPVTKNTEVLRVEAPAGEAVFAADNSPEFAKKFADEITMNGKLTYGTSKDEAKIVLDRDVDEITFIHAADISGTDLYDRRVMTWFFLDKTPYILAHYVFEYEDGIVTAVPIEFGVQVGDIASDFSWKYPEEYEKRFDDEDQVEADESIKMKPTAATYSDQWLNAAMYFSDAYPVELDGERNALYAWKYKNPRPEVKIKSVKLVADKDDSAPIRLFGCIV